MAMWSANKPTWTPVAVADTTNMTAAGFVAVQGGSSTQSLRIHEVYLGGQAGSSSPTYMLLARDSTVFAGATSNAVRNAALHTATAALAAPTLAQDVGSTTLPQRSATLSLANLSFNAFGGIVRWVSKPEEDIWVLGNTASLGEVSLSAYTGGTPGLLGSHIIYETF